MVVYAARQAKELVQLLEHDQAEIKRVGRLYFEPGTIPEFAAQRAELARNTRKRARRMLEIIDEIGEPSLSLIGADAAQAVSILALHSSLGVTKRVLTAFTALYDTNKDNVYFQAIPSMTDWVLLLEHKPQRFGTQWLFDKNKEPYLPPVEDFAHVNERRAEYGIEPLRWPKSLAIPEAEQPWLQRPLAEASMRDPTEEEYQELVQNHLD